MPSALGAGPPEGVQGAPTSNLATGAAPTCSAAAGFSTVVMQGTPLQHCSTLARQFSLWMPPPHRLVGRSELVWEIEDRALTSSGMVVMELETGEMEISILFPQFLAPL